MLINFRLLETQGTLLPQETGIQSVSAVWELAVCAPMSAVAGIWGPVQGEEFSYWTAAPGPASLLFFKGKIYLFKRPVSQGESGETEQERNLPLAEGLLRWLHQPGTRNSRSLVAGAQVLELSLTTS